MTEIQIKSAVSKYLRMQYPKVIFRWDIGADIRLTIGQAKKSKNIHLHQRGYPDLSIMQPVEIAGNKYCGLFVELKKKMLNCIGKTAKGF